MSKYTQIINKKEYSDDSLSIGYRRIVCIPARMRKSMHKAYILSNKERILKEMRETGKVDDGYTFIVDFFSGMSEAEFMDYVNTH